jgi:hypothetical protein
MVEAMAILVAHQVTEAQDARAWSVRPPETAASGCHWRLSPARGVQGRTTSPQVTGVERAWLRARRRWARRVAGV